MKPDWWRDIAPDLWRFAAEDERGAREDYAAILAALLRLSSSTTMASMHEIFDQMAQDGRTEAMAPETFRNRIDELVQVRLVLPFVNPRAHIGDLRDGYQRREAWALSKYGRIVVHSVREAVSNLDRVLQLPPKLIDSIHDTIRRLLLHLDKDPLRVAPDIAAIRHHVSQIDDVAGDYYEAMRSLNQQDVTDDQIFGQSRSRIMVVLRQFVQDTQTALRPLRESLGHLREADFDVIAEVGAHGAGAIGRDASGWIDGCKTDLQRLDLCFSPGGTIDRLVDSAVVAIEILLSAITRRFNHLNRASDLGADFRQLARLIHAQPDDTRAGAVFSAATGLWTAQHPHTDLEDDDLRPLLTTQDAPGVELEVTLKRTLRSPSAPRAAKRMTDLTAQRELEEDEAIRELDRLARLATELTTPGRVSLDFFADLDAQHLQVLVDMLQDALDAFDPKTGCGISRSLDCQVTITPGRTDTVVTVKTADGTLTAPDIMIEITPVAPAVETVGR